MVFKKVIKVMIWCKGLDKKLKVKSIFYSKNWEALILQSWENHIYKKDKCSHCFNKLGPFITYIWNLNKAIG